MSAAWSQAQLSAYLRKLPRCGVCHGNACPLDGGARVLVIGWRWRGVARERRRMWLCRWHVEQGAPWLVLRPRYHVLEALRKLRVDLLLGVAP
jgi:hypothetical protein